MNIGSERETSSSGGTSVTATYAPSMYSEPCAKLTMRVTPNTIVRPEAMMNRDEALARPFRNWTAMKAGSMGPRTMGSTFDGAPGAARMQRGA